VFTIGAMFDDFDIACWFLDATCSTCGALLTAPCPADRPDGKFDELSEGDLGDFFDD